MRLSVISIKGGVGKSTVSILLSLELNRLKRGVALIDMDLSGYTSFLAGFDRPGLFSSISDGLDHREYFRDEERIRIIKLAGDGPRLKLDAEKMFKDKSLLKKFQDAYLEVLSFPHEYTILDNYPLSSPTDKEVALEREAYSLKYYDQCYDIKVTDSNNFDVNQTIEYAMYQKTSDSCRTFALVINMIPSKSRKQYFEDDMTNLLDKIGANVGILVPFIEDLFQYSGPIKNIPRLSQFSKLAEMIVKGEVGEGKLVISY